MEKEIELGRRLRDKENEQRVLEDRVRRVEREVMDVDQKLSLQKTGKASEETRLVQFRS